MTDLKSREPELLLYTAADGVVKVGVLFRDETAWLTQKALAELFGVGVPAVNKHLKNIFESGELAPAATISKTEMVRSEGGREVTRTVEIYNLDAIIAVGYRINSYQATQLRISSYPILADKGKVSALEAQGRGRIRGLPQAAGRGVRLGLRSRCRGDKAARGKLREGARRRRREEA